MRKVGDAMPQARFPSAVSFSSLTELLKYRSNRTPNASAILAPGRLPLSYGHLYEHIENTGRTLRSLGIGRKDRVALVLPNGPEMASAILALAASATCVPLNPAYGTEELDRYIADLGLRALIVPAGIDLTARRVGLSRGVPIVELSSLGTAAGLFELTGKHRATISDETVSETDIAVLLLTSGTTSRPKIVPLIHANICASARSSVKALELTETDRCINVVPLFHGHGLNNVLLASLAAGGSVVCAPGCDVHSFFGWLRQFRPSWYSAVPTMHQAIIAQARRERSKDFRLRFIRSSSAPLSQHVIAELERSFEAPVVEFYGMTETASSPIACNPLPPRQRKPGSVGLPVDLDVAVVDERGDLLPKGQIGEIVVRGRGVIKGYDGDPVATKAAFAGDWFKTGDLGLFDDDGYLFLKGRLREVINRGGEKVTPQEVDDILLKHPAVAEAVTFALPHHTLGEDVAAAVVLRPHSAATPKDIRQFAIGRIADFKVPRQILIVNDIPKGLTGKVQRSGLAAKLGLSTNAAVERAFVAARTPLEIALAKHWAEILSIDKVGIHDDFFALGGDSLLATDVLTHVYDVTQIELAFSQFFEAPTIAEVVQRLEHLSQAGQAHEPSLPIIRLPRGIGSMPASIAQERIWNFQQLVPDVPFFNVLYALRLTSPVNTAVLQQCIDEIVRRHEMLRTTFGIVDGRHVQIVAPHLTVPLVFKVVHHSESKENVVRSLIRQELLHCFDLARGPLLRTHLVAVDEKTSLFLITMHVIIQDGWSLGVFIREIATLYGSFIAGLTSPLAPLPIQYADFAHWQRQWRSSPDIVNQFRYWREQLHDPLPRIKLGIGHSAEIVDFRKGHLKVACPAELTDAAKGFSQRQGVTLFMTLVAALKILLHRYVGENDLRIATHVANRNRALTEGLIGRLVNTVILRTDLGGDPTAQEVVRRVRATSVAAFANQDLPFEEVVAAFEHERSLDRSALAQVLFWLQNSSLRPETSSAYGLVFEEVDPSTLTHPAIITAFDLMLMLRESAKGLVGTCIYNPHLFSAEAVECLFRDFQHVLREIILQPQRRISEIVMP